MSVQRHLTLSPPVRRASDTSQFVGKESAWWQEWVGGGGVRSGDQGTESSSAPCQEPSLNVWRDMHAGARQTPHAASHPLPPDDRESRKCPVSTPTT